MIADAVDTLITLGWALAAWIAALALVAAVVLHTVAVLACWAWRALSRGVTAALSLSRHFDAPELPPAPHKPSGARTARPVPSWADTHKEAA